MNYSARLEHLSNQYEALLIENQTDLLYLTGLELSAGKLIITQSESCLFVDGRYFESARKKSPCPVVLLEDQSLKKWIIAHSLSSLTFDSDKTTYQRFLQLQKLVSELAEKKNEFALLPAENPVMKLRLIKDEDEMAILRKAAQLGYEGFEFVCSQLREGISEAEVALELEFFWKKRGAKKLAFEPIIAFGPNSSMPHYRAGKGILKKGMPVLIDIGVVWQHYHSDMTRVLFFEGEPEPLMQSIYTIVEEAQKKALALCRPGTLVGDLDAAARDWITSQGYGPYFTHSLGHGLGLDIHEPPILRVNGTYKDMSLEAGMVLTIEPGIYLPDVGGVRLEDTILITADGYENLTKNKALS